MPPPRINWTPEMERTLLQALLDQANNGGRAERGYKKEAWIAAESVVQRLCPTLSHSQAKNKHDSYKWKWKTWLEIGQHSEFWWNEDTQLYQAGDDEWDLFIASHPQAKSLRFIPLPNKPILKDLFNVTVDTKRTAREIRPRQQDTEPDVNNSLRDLPENSPDRGRRPDSNESTRELAENAFNQVSRLDNNENRRESPEKAPNQGRRPDSNDNTTESPENAPNQGRWPDINENMRETPENAPNRGRRPDINDNMRKSPEKAPNQGRRPDISDNTRESPENAPNQGRWPDINDNMRETPENAPNRGRRPDTNHNMRESLENAPNRGRRPINDNVRVSPENAPHRGRMPNINESTRESPANMPNQGRWPNINNGMREPPENLPIQGRRRAASPDPDIENSDMKRLFTEVHVISASVDRIGAQLEKNRSGREECQQSLTSRAIRKLEMSYNGRISEDDMQLGIELFTNPAKADVFLSLMPGSRRDRWLKTSLGIWTSPA